VRRACLPKVTCSACEESRPPIWESRPGPRRSAGSTHGLAARAGKRPRTLSHACQAVSAPGTDHSPSSVATSSRRLVACTCSRRSERNAATGAGHASASAHQATARRCSGSSPRSCVSGRRSSSGGSGSGVGTRGSAIPPYRATLLYSATVAGFQPRAAASGSRPVSPSCSGPKPSSRAASASRRHCASYPGGASSRRQARSGGGAGMSGRGCCHPPRMSQYYRYPQQKRATNLSSPADVGPRRPPGGISAIAGACAWVGTGPAGGAAP